MQNKKKAISPKKPKHEKTFIEKLGEKASHLKEELIAGKDHLLEAAGETIESVKSSIHEYTAGKKTATKKATNKIKKPVRRKTGSLNKIAEAGKKIKKIAIAKKLPAKKNNK